jgi:hypothetical protein
VNEFKKSIVSDFCVDGEACGGNQRYIFDGI